MLRDPGGKETKKMRNKQEQRLKEQRLAERAPEKEKDVKDIKRAVTINGALSWIVVIIESDVYPPESVISLDLAFRVVLATIYVYTIISVWLTIAVWIIESSWKIGYTALAAVVIAALAFIFPLRGMDLPTAFLTAGLGSVLFIFIPSCLKAWDRGHEAGVAENQADVLIDKTGDHIN